MMEDSLQVITIHRGTTQKVAIKEVTSLPITITLAAWPKFQPHLDNTLSVTRS